MRKPVKPFVTEHKTRRGPPKSAALFDPSLFGEHGDEKPPRDIRQDDLGDDDGLEAALRAADSVFGGGAPKAEAVSKTPEADAVFRPRDDAGTIDKPAEPPKRVLADLTVSDPLAERLAAAAEIRRGRKPGTKNKPKAEAGLLDGDAVIKRGRPPGSKNKPKTEVLPVKVDEAAIDLVVSTATIAARQPRAPRRPYVGFRAAQAAAKSLPPRHQWKLRTGRSQPSPHR